jgi:hypothetical protein
LSTNYKHPNPRFVRGFWENIFKTKNNRTLPWKQSCFASNIPWTIEKNGVYILIYEFGIDIYTSKSLLRRFYGGVAQDVAQKTVGGVAQDVAQKTVGGVASRCRWSLY